MIALSPGAAKHSFKHDGGKQQIAVPAKPCFAVCVRSGDHPEIAVRQTTLHVSDLDPKIAPNRFQKIHRRRMLHGGHRIVPVRERLSAACLISSIQLI